MREIEQEGPRERIRDAALALFFERGFHATTVRDVMAACGLSPSALYNHYGSKEALLYELVAGSHAGVERAMREQLAGAGADPGDQLHALLVGLSRFHTEQRMLAMVGTLEYRHLPESERLEIVARRAGVRAALEAVLRRGVAEGRFALPAVGDGRDAAKVAATALANLAMRLSEAFGPEPGADRVALAQHHAELALAMVLYKRSFT